MRDTYESGYAKSRERFERDTAEHEMAVLHDDGVYRHVRFQQPGTSCYYYDLVTWPGHLAICGDMGDWTFSRIRDMFEFFAGERQAAGINPSYWSQKLRGDRAGRDISRRYSEDALRAHVIDWFEQQAGLAAKTGRVPRWEAVQEMRRWRGARFTRRWRRRQLLSREGEMPVGRALALSRALETDVLCGGWEHDTSYEEGAQAALRAFEFPNRDDVPFNAPCGIRIAEPWEWDLRDYDGSFLWACWAIRRGIERYRASAPAMAAAA